MIDNGRGSGSFATPEVPTADQGRRGFLKAIGTVTAATATASAGGVSLLLTPSVIEAAEIGPVTAKRRRDQAFRVRYEAAVDQRNQPLALHPTNGDEERYQNGS